MKQTVLYHESPTSSAGNACIETVTREALYLSESFLTQSEKEEESFVLEEKREGWRMGRLAVKRVIQTFGQSYDISLTVDDIIIRSGQDKIPYVITSKSLPPFHFSLSHTRDFAAAALVSSQVAQSIGIDAEQIQTFKPETVENFLNDTEYQKFIDSENPAFFATQYWCLKESYLKARKVGLRVHPQRIHCKIGMMNTCIEFIEDGVLIPTKTYWTVVDGVYMLASVQLIINS